MRNFNKWLLEVDLHIFSTTCPDQFSIFVGVKCKSVSWDETNSFNTSDCSTYPLNEATDHLWAVLCVIHDEEISPGVRHVRGERVDAEVSYDTEL